MESTGARSKIILDHLWGKYPGGSRIERIAKELILDIGEVKMLTHYAAEES